VPEIKKNANDWEALDPSQGILNKPKSNLHLIQLEQLPRGIFNIYK
jgi:hypothetical protein